MLKARLCLAAVVFVISCSGNSSLAPTSPSAAIVAGSGADEPISTRQVDLHEVNDAAALTFTVSGVVTDKAYPAWKFGEATVTAGTVSAKTNSQAVYSLKVRAGRCTIKVGKWSHSTASIRRSIDDTTKVNVALNPAKPAGATVAMQGPHMVRVTSALGHLLAS
jgi:hypothetical protein